MKWPLYDDIKCCSVAWLLGCLLAVVICACAKLMFSVVWSRDNEIYLARVNFVENARKTRTKLFLSESLFVCVFFLFLFFVHVLLWLGRKGFKKKKTIWSNLDVLAFIYFFLFILVLLKTTTTTTKASSNKTSLITRTDAFNSMLYFWKWTSNIISHTGTDTRVWDFKLSFGLVCDEFELHLIHIFGRWLELWIYKQ